MIRQMVAGEWEIFRDLRLAALKTDPSSFGSRYEDAVRWSDEEWIERSGVMPVWFAFDDGRAVGMIRLCEDEDPPEIISLCVGPDYRRRGMAKALMEAAIDAARPRPVVLSVYETNVNALALDTSLGFTQCGTEVDGGRVELTLIRPR